MRLTPTGLLTLVLLASPAAAASVGELEREATRMAAERDELRAQRQQLIVEASALAERVSSLKQPGVTSRAGRDLTRQLQEFDRVASRIDGVDQRIAGLEQRLARVRAEFERAASLAERTAEQRARSEGPQAVAAELAALASSRLRLAAMEEATRFRPVLEVSVAPLDGLSEIEAKLAIIDGERLRVAERLAELRREELLLLARLDAKRDWLRQLGIARRDAAGAVELLDRAHEQAEAALRTLVARGEAITRERAALQVCDKVLAAGRRVAEERLRTLEQRQETR